MRITTQTKSTMIVNRDELVEIIRRGCGSGKFSSAEVEFYAELDDAVTGAAITVVETTNSEED